MKPLPRIDDIKGEPEVGTWYNVPCLPWRRFGDDTNRDPAADIWLPVLGPRHADPEINEFAGKPHRHLDWRFISKMIMLAVFDRAEWHDSLMGHLTWYDGKPQYLRRRCARRMPVFPASEKLVAVCEAAVAGKCIDPQRPVCPHRGFPLHQMPVGEDGCIVCPGHGVKWNATTGEMVSRLPEVEEKQRQRWERIYGGRSQMIVGKGEPHA